MNKSLAIMGLLLASTTASAQQYLPAGLVELASGLESGGGGFQRARTRLRVGVELRVDEDEENGIAGAALIDLEPKSSFGGDFRYIHAFSPKFALSAGGIAYLAPATLLGPCAAMDFRFGKKMQFTVGPEATAFVVGSDLPDNRIVWQALVHWGLRANF